MIVPSKLNCVPNAGTGTAMLSAADVHQVQQQAKLIVASGTFAFARSWPAAKRFALLEAIGRELGSDEGGYVTAVEEG